MWAARMIHLKTLVESASADILHLILWIDCTISSVDVLCIAPQQLPCNH